MLFLLSKQDASLDVLIFTMAVDVKRFVINHIMMILMVTIPVIHRVILFVILVIK